ncbi:MAG: HDOD domain-containing protein [Proteobacteria bacterium]|nr:HDOD domain-containing protein [Pseudomonadota bacterium]
MAITASELVKDIAGLVTLPDVFLRISRLIDDPNSSSSDIAKAVSRDPSFTLRLLKVANSSLYSFSAPVTTVAKAVSIIGTSQIRSLALSMSVAKTFAGLPNALVSMENFWRHSLYCALIARHLAKSCRGCDPDTLFTAGLLHDIGELVIFNRLPVQAEEALLAVLDSQDQLQVHQAEQQVMGLDHAEVGGTLARLWHIPAQLEECIAHHHDIAGAIRYPRETALIHLANVFALMAEVDTLDLADVSPIDPGAWELVGLGEDCIAPAVREAREEIKEAEQLFTV